MVKKKVIIATLLIFFSFLAVSFIKLQEPPEITSFSYSIEGTNIILVWEGNAESYELYIKRGSSWKSLANLSSPSFIHTLSKNLEDYLVGNSLSYKLIPKNGEMRGEEKLLEVSLPSPFFKAYFPSKTNQTEITIKLESNSSLECSIFPLQSKFNLNGTKMLELSLKEGENKITVVCSNGILTKEQNFSVFVDKEIGFEAYFNNLNPNYLEVLLISQEKLSCSFIIGNESYASSPFKKTTEVFESYTSLPFSSQISVVCNDSLNTLRKDFNLTSKSPIFLIFAREDKVIFRGEAEYCRIKGGEWLSLESFLDYIKLYLPYLKDSPPSIECKSSSYFSSQKLIYKP